MTAETPSAFRIRYERTGGVSGRRVARDVASDALAAAEAARGARLVADSGFHRLPKRMTARAPIADRFVFRVTIETGGRAHTIVADEEAVPPALRPLLDWLHGTSA
ncbi:MAG: protealysin inhibitor emfourin [bacterium]